MHKLYALLAVFMLASLAACGNRDTIPDPEPTDTTYGDDMGADTGAYGDESMGEGESFGDDQFAEELASVVYFDFDSSELRPADAEIVTRHARQLVEHPEWNVRLEGHADERGSREYNIGLGERRAQSVRRMLLIQGAAASQISTVSFGEERPVALGSTEEAYAQNRRVELKYGN
jgi:peptidoglycan-associated lipoprotein